MQPRDGSAAVREIIGNGTEVLPRLRPLTAAEFLRLDLPPRALLLDPWLPTQGLAMIHSVRGIGKTYLALGIAYAVSAGGGLLGWRAPMPRRVLYLDGEMPAAAMRRRLAAIIAGYDGEPPALDYLRLLTADIIDGGLPDLGTEAGQAEIDAAIGDAELIVVDAVIQLRRPPGYMADQGARFEIVFTKARGLYGDVARPIEARYEERDGLVSGLVRRSATPS
jgi:hypothetical protein